MTQLLTFTHLVAVSIFIGATVLLGVAIETTGTQALDAAGRRRRYAELFRAYNPLAIAVLGVVVMTGAWSLTPYKEGLGAGYYQQVGEALVGKLSLAFVVIILATWLAFGIGHRLVRADLGALPVTDAELDRLLMRLRVALWLTLSLSLLTVWLALGMSPPVLAG